MVAIASGEDDFEMELVPTGKKGTKGKKGKEPNVNKQCVICFELAANNQRFCKPCKQDIAVAKKQAYDDHVGDEWEEGFQDDVLLRQTMHDFRLKCPSMGKGTTRRHFDWARWVRENFKEKYTNKFSKRKWMDYVDFVIWMVNKRRKTEHEADVAWKALLDDPDSEIDEAKDGVFRLGDNWPLCHGGREGGHP